MDISRDLANFAMEQNVLGPVFKGSIPRVVLRKLLSVMITDLNFE